MGVFLYYVPGVARQDVTRELLIERGLSVAFADVLAAPGPVESRLTLREVRNGGPDNRHGVILCPTPIDASGGSQRIGHYADSQEWEAVDGFRVESLELRENADSTRPPLSSSPPPQYWLGIDREDPPTPEALRRPETIDGYEHTLGDKRAWVCPIIRRCFVTPMVPRAYRRRGESLVGEVLADYRSIWERSAKWAAAAYADEARGIDEWFDGAVDCLALNYRLGPEEVGRLGLLTDRTMRLVIEAAIDDPWMREAIDDPEKKSAVERVIRVLRNTSPGQEDCSPDTPPVGGS